MTDVIPFLMPLAGGLLLAAATGLRTFLPLCILSWAAYFDIIPLNDSFRWLDSLSAVLCFTAAVIVEVIGDKFPVVDHALDVIGTFTKPIAALVVVAASLNGIDPLYAVIAGIIGGSSVATVVHVVKAKGRLLANAASMGLAAPVLSIIEDGLCAGIAIAAILVPIVAVVLLVLAILFMRRRRTLRRQHA